MRPCSQAPRLLLATLVCLSACSEALYPPRPAQVAGPPVADPPHSKAVIHLAISSAGLAQILDSTVPKTGEGLFTLIGTRAYRWTRGPFELRFDQTTGRIGVTADVQGEADLPATKMRFTLKLSAAAQPVLSADYKASLQSPQVEVTSEDRLLRAADWSAGVLGSIKNGVEKELKNLRVDLRPMLQQTYARMAKPIPFKLGDASACASLGIRAVEAGPTVLAGGVEKDLAVVLAPSVTLPCAAAEGPAPPLPPLHNVASLPSGPFTVVVPVAASYEELQKAMTQAFSGGKLFFSKEHPELYLERPEVYASAGQIVVKVHLAGFVKKGFKISLTGDLYLMGNPQVRDNHLEVPDLQHSVDTRDALLKLKTRVDADSIQKEVRQALRLDISDRLRSVRARLSTELSFQQGPKGQGPAGCVKADVGRVEITGIYAHDSYLRLYVQTTAQAALYVPCL